MYTFFHVANTCSVYRQILLKLHCKYLRPNYDGITAYHRTSTIIHCNDPLQLNIPIATIRYTKNYSGMIVKCQQKFIAGSTFLYCKNHDKIYETLQSDFIVDIGINE